MSKAELPNVFSPLIIPDNHLIRLKARVIACADERKNVAAEEHFDETNSPAI
jgi:hypothetical protein